MRLLRVLLAWCLAKAAKVYRCKWPRSVLSSGDPNLMVTVDGSEVRCDRTGDANYICPAACDYGQSNPDSCFGPIEDGGVCNTVWERNSQSFYTMESFNTTHACTRRWNSDCSADMGGTACHELGQCYGSYQMITFDQPTFLEKYGYEPSFLQQPWEILEPPSCAGHTSAECCMLRINYYRCLHGAPPLVYHEGIAASAQEWASKQDKGSIHSNWGGSFFPHYTEVLTWGTDSCERGAKSWYAEIGVHNFSINAVQGGSYNSGHMVLLLWHNHTMLGCGFGDNTNGNPIVVCDFAWAHQGHKGDDAWEANLRGRTGATQDECRTIAEGSLSFPVLQAGDDISAEQVAALRSGQVPGQNTEQSSTTGATGGTDTAGTTVDEDGSVTTSSDTGSKSRASSWSLNAFWLASAALFSVW